MTQGLRGGHCGTAGTAVWTMPPASCAADPPQMRRRPHRRAREAPLPPRVRRPVPASFAGPSGIEAIAVCMPIRLPPVAPDDFMSVARLAAATAASTEGFSRAPGSSARAHAHDVRLHDGSPRTARFAEPGSATSRPRPFQSVITSAFPVGARRRPQGFCRQVIARCVGLSHILLGRVRL